MTELESIIMSMMWFLSGIAVGYVFFAKKGGKNVTIKYLNIMRAIVTLISGTKHRMDSPFSARMNPRLRGQ